MATYSEEGGGTVDTQDFYGGSWADNMGGALVGMLGNYLNTQNQIDVIQATAAVNASNPTPTGASVAVSERGLSLSPGMLMLLGVGVLAVFMLRD